MKVILDGRWNDTVGDKCWKVANDLLVLLRQTCKRTKAKIAVSGLNALLWYQAAHGVGPKWSVEVEEETCDYACLVWGAGKCGKTGIKKLIWTFQDCAKEQGLKVRVKTVQRCCLLKRKEGGRGNVSGSEEDGEGSQKIWLGWRNSAERRKEKMKLPWAVEVSVGGWEQKITFVQLGEAHDVASALEKLYPLNVERVAFEVTRQVFGMKAEERQSISEGRARTDRVEFEVEGCPTEQEIRRVTQGLRKMKDYTRRGFRFAADRGVAFKSDGILML